MLLLRAGLYLVGLLYALANSGAHAPLALLGAGLALFLLASRMLEDDTRSATRLVLTLTEAALAAGLVLVADGGRGPAFFLLAVGALLASLESGTAPAICYACLGLLVTCAQPQLPASQLVFRAALTLLAACAASSVRKPGVKGDERRTQAIALQRAQEAARTSGQVGLQREQELFDERRKLEALMDVSHRMAVVRRPEELLHTIAACAMEQMQVEAAVIMLRRGDDLVVEWSEGVSAQACKNLACRNGEGLLGTLAVNGEGFLYSNLDSRESLKPFGALGGLEALLADPTSTGGFSTRVEAFRCFMVAPLRSPQDRSPMGLLLVANRLRKDRFSPHDLGYLQILATDAAISLRNLFSLGELERSHYEMIQALAQAIEAKDSYTHGHVGRVRQYSVQLARAMGLPAQFIEDVDKAAILHDVGKISTPDRVLLKEGPLDNEEFEIMKQHASESVRILRDIRSVSPEVQKMVLHHHERVDGKGYPAGLKGDEIPLGAQIIAVADCYDAMTSDRPYRKGFAPIEAMRKMEHGAGSQHNMQILAYFFALSNYLPENNAQVRALTEQAKDKVGANLLRLPEPSRVPRGIMSNSESQPPPAPKVERKRLELGE